MKIELHNTLSGKKELFKPLQAGKVGMYHCGPTVYDRAHIGNLRSYVFADTLRRLFEYSGYTVDQVINITDVGHLSSDADHGEDKMTKAINRENMSLSLESMREIGTKYMDSFIDDLKELNIELPQSFPRASDHIKEDIELIRLLESKGYAYRTEDGMYFDTDKFSEYGKIAGGRSKLPTDESFARIAQASGKKSHLDFALWKFDSKLGFESDWGRGFPGWHIECSAMARKYLGQPFDIHTGGIDHIPVHHNNEIAQSEAAYGVPLAEYWMHNAFITIKNAKMAKSEGNFITLQTLQDEAISPLAYRYWLLTGHYRSPVNFTYKAVQASQNALIRLLATVSVYPDGGVVIEAYKAKFDAFVSDDLDIPQAIALMWDLIKDADASSADKRATILSFDTIFGLNMAAMPRPEHEEVPVEITVLAEAREEARKSKEWAKADALRQEISARGYDVKDTPEGFSVVRI